MKKFGIVLCSILLIQMTSVGCSKKPTENVSPSPVATPTVPATITNPEGRVMETETPGVEGMVTELTDEKIDVKVKGETWNFQLSENAVRELSIYNKDEQNKRITVGTFVIVYYEEIDSVKYAKNIEILISN